MWLQSGRNKPILRAQALAVDTVLAGQIETSGKEPEGVMLCLPFSLRDQGFEVPGPLGPGNRRVEHPRVCFVVMLLLVFSPSDESRLRAED